MTRDISERKSLDEALQRNERRLRELLEALPAAIYVTDAAGYVTYCNQAAIELWETAPAFGEDRWCDLAGFYHRDDTPMPIEECPTEIALKEGRTTRNQEAILKRRDGTRIAILPCPGPLYDARGAVVGVVNMTINISERRRAEMALAERNMQLNLAGKVALVGTFAFDVLAGRMTISPGTRPSTTCPKELRKAVARNGAREFIPTTSPALKDTSSRRSQTNGMTTIATTALFTLTETCGGSSPAAMCRTRSIGRGWLVPTSMSPVASSPNVLWACAKSSLAEKAAGVGTYAYDVDNDIMQISEGYAVLHGLFPHAPAFQAPSTSDQVKMDPLRVIEAITAGVAFLAAGTIVQARGEVHGLTTGAGMWLSGAVGLACGLGYWKIAFLGAELAIIVLAALYTLENKFGFDDSVAITSKARETTSGSP